MAENNVDAVPTPLARYAPFRRAGDFVYVSGLIAADPVTGILVNSYADLPEEVRDEAGRTGEMSVDLKEGPIAAQSWKVFDSLRSVVNSAGGALDDVVHLAQYFTDLRDFPVYSRLRDKFFDSPPASTVLEVSGMLPSEIMRIEVQAVAYIPRERSSLEQ